VEQHGENSGQNANSTTSAHSGRYAAESLAGYKRNLPFESQDWISVRSLEETYFRIFDDKAIETKGTCVGNSKIKFRCVGLTCSLL
jgi:hypothetical protein